MKTRLSLRGRPRFSRISGPASLAPQTSLQAERRTNQLLTCRRPMFFNRLKCASLIRYPIDEALYISIAAKPTRNLQRRAFSSFQPSESPTATPTLKTNRAPIAVPSRSLPHKMAPTTPLGKQYMSSGTKPKKEVDVPRPSARYFFPSPPLLPPHLTPQ